MKPGFTAKPSFVARIGANEGVTRHYVGGIEYFDGEMEAIYHEAGRVVFDNSNVEYEYRLEDHLGNTRSVFRDDGSGVAERIQQNNYYAFGLAFEDEFKEYAYTFGNKEVQSELGLDWLDFNARFLMSDIGRWGQIDPSVESFLNVSPYNYSNNSPILYADPTGSYPNPTTSLWHDEQGSHLSGNVREKSEARQLRKDKTVVYKAPTTDPSLDYSSLSTNSDYVGLTTSALRDQLSGEYSNLEQWQINISAGVALENAFSFFTRHSRGWNQLSTKGDSYTALKVVRPDFVHPTEVVDPDGKVIRFNIGGIIEVKAPQNPIDLTTNSSQIDAELNLARYASGNDGKAMGLFATRAHEVKGGAFTLVLPFGSSISNNLISEVTKRNVNLYVSYAFQNIHDRTVVFSNPMRLNFVADEITTPQPGSINRRANLEFNRAVVYWQNTNNSPTE